MGKCYTKRKLNNSGSTLVMAIIMISFITLLASVMMSMSLTNIAMKHAENNSKKSFYSAEAALDEIYAGLGIEAMNSLSSAYDEVASSLVEMVEIGGVSVPVETDNKTANKRLKEYYINNIYYAITGKNVENIEKFNAENTNNETTDLIENAINILSGYIKNKDMASVRSIGSIAMEKKDSSGNDIYSMILKNTVVSYINENNYFATVTVDISLDFPDITANFSKETRILTAFSQYALIADENINMQGAGVTINSNILSGKNINIFNGSKVKCNGAGEVNIVAGGNIILETDGKGVSTLNIAGCDVWCNNIELITSSGTKGSILSIDNNSNAYVKDDLSLNGRGSIATLGGNYYGYSYEGYGNIQGKLQDKSSAIVINGKEANLNINTHTIMIGGHAYIDFNQDAVDAYMTGEALSVKGNQDIYLVVDEYITGKGTDGNAVHNPMSYEDWMKISNNNTVYPIDLKGFFAYDLLDSERPYIIKYVDGKYYVYLNFKSKLAASQYFMAIVDDAYFKKLYPRATSAKKEERNALKFDLNKNLILMLGDNEAIKVSGNGKVYSTGTVFEMKNNDSIKAELVNTDAEYVKDAFVANGGSIGSYDGFALSAINYGNRYELLTHLCLSIPKESNGKEYIVNDTLTSFNHKNEVYTVTAENLKTSAANNIVDFELVKNNPYNSNGEVTGGYLVMAADDSVIIPNTARYGIIIATGDVTVNADFTGIIITQGNIYISGNAKISNASLNEIRGYENIKKYLYAYKDYSTISDNSLSKVEYSDIVKISNWRKNED